MPNPWFRMYSEFAHDPKVLMMPEPMQARLVKVLCLRCAETLETLHETELAFHLRISEVELAETKAVFVQKGFVDDQWNVLNWAARQFVSDSSTSRVRKYRQAKKQDETLPKQSETLQNANVTVQNRTDTEQIQKHKPLASTALAVPAERGKLLGTLPCAGGKTYEVREDDLQRDVGLFPGVDVPQEYRSMKAWLLASPERQKTLRGIRKFMANWLSNEQNKGGKNGTVQRSGFAGRSEKNLQAAENAARFDTQVASHPRREPTGNSARDGLLDLLESVGRVPEGRPGGGDSGTLLEGTPGGTHSVSSTWDDHRRDAATGE